MTKKEFLQIPGVKNRLEQLAAKHGFTVDEILTVIQKESNFKTTAENPKSKATGLIQFMPDTAKGLGTSIEEIKEMNALAQIDVIDKFFTQNHTKGQHPYVTVAYPRAARMGMDDVIATKDSVIAKQNPVWQDKDGNVTKRSILKYVGVENRDKTKAETTPKATDDDVTVDGGELPEVTVEEQGTTVDAGELPEVTVEEEEKTYDAGKLPEIKIEDKKDADVIKSLPPENLSVDNEGQLFIVEQEGNNTVAKAAIKGSVPGETQYVQVMGPNDQIITIPIGENVTQEDIKRSFKLQETGEIEYTNFDEVYKNIDNIDKSRPIKIQENRYKWDKDKNEFRVINDDGTFKLGKEGQINPNFIPNTFQKEAKKRQEKIKEERAKEMMIDQDGDGIPDTIDIDGGTGTDESLVTPETVDTTEQTDENVTNVPSTPLEGLAGLGSSLIKGAGKVLDYVGGPGGIISYVLGKKGLAEAMKEVKPQASAKLSPMFMQHLRQSRELAKKGFHPDEANKFRNEIDYAYQLGLENAVRGTNGNRARFLAQSGVLDAQRSSALLDFAAKDDELQRKNADKYEKLMMFKENFDIQQTEKERTEDMKRQQANKDAAVKFTGAAFANVLSGLGGSSLSNTTPAGGSPFYNFIDNVGNESVSLKDLQELINKQKDGQ